MFRFSIFCVLFVFISFSLAGITASGTLIQASQGNKDCRKFNRGDKVMAGSIVNGRIVWLPKEVGFVSITSATSGTPAVFIYFGDKQQLIVSMDHLFLLQGYVWKRADKLAPGDLLLDPSGSPVTVHQVSVSSYRGSFAGIATSLSFKGSTDNHLLNTGGVISGDYVLQMYQEQLLPGDR